VYAEALQQELRPDERQDRGEPVVQVDESVYQPLQREVEGPQAQHGEGVGRVRDKDAGGDGEHSRHGVYGEHDVRGLDDDQRGQKRRGVELAILAHEEVVALVIPGRRQDAPHQLEHAAALRVCVLVAAAEHAQGCEEEERAEGEDEPVEG